MLVLLGISCLHFCIAHVRRLFDSCPHVLWSQASLKQVVAFLLKVCGVANNVKLNGACKYYVLNIDILGLCSSFTCVTEYLV